MTHTETHKHKCPDCQKINHRCALRPCKPAPGVEFGKQRCNECEKRRRAEAEDMSLLFRPPTPKVIERLGGIPI